MTWQPHPALVKQVYQGSLARALSLPGAKVVCWRPNLAGTRQYKGEPKRIIHDEKYHDFYFFYFLHQDVFETANCTALQGLPEVCLH